MKNTSTIFGALLTIVVVSSSIFQVASFLWTGLATFTVFLIAMILKINKIGKDVIRDDVFKTVENVYHMYVITILFASFHFYLKYFF